MRSTSISWISDEGEYLVFLSIVFMRSNDQRNSDPLVNFVVHHPRSSFQHSLVAHI